MFEEKQAKELIEAGVCVPVDADEDNLPDDLPGRNHIKKAGLSLDELKEVKDFTAIPGIFKAMAQKIVEYLKPE